MSLCESKCLICGKPGLFDTNFSGFHKICEDHKLSDSSSFSCIFCKSEVLIFEEFLNCSKCEGNKALSKCKCGVNLCDACVRTCRSCGSHFCQDCQSFVDSASTCKRCKPEEKKSKKILSTMSLQRPKKLANQTTQGTCNNCSKPGEVVQSSRCNHLLCLDCLDKNCDICLTVTTSRINNSSKQGKKAAICSVCKNELKSLNKLRICLKCEENHVNKRFENDCKNCGEHDQKASITCGHIGCTRCQNINIYCFECITGNRIDMKLKCKKCSFCTENKECFNLLCSHGCCLKCFDEFEVKKLNFMCRECILVKEKYCISCRNLAIWENIEQDERLIRTCCEKYKVCSKCMKVCKWYGHSCKFPKREPL